MRKDFDEYVAGLDGVKAVYHKAQNKFQRPDGTTFCTSEFSPHSSVLAVTFTDLTYSLTRGLPDFAQADSRDHVRIRVVSRSRLEIVMKMAKERLG